jgi:hypothetical protein
MDCSIAEAGRGGENQDLFTAEHAEIAEKNFCLAFLCDLGVLGGKSSCRRSRLAKIAKIA